MQPSKTKLIEVIRNYKMPEAAKKLLADHPPLMVAGVTASGKSSVIKHIEQSSEYRHVVTHTTRQPRAGEQNGKNYWFVDIEQLLFMALKHDFIEIKEVHGTFYGTSIAAYQSIIDNGDKPLLVIDVQGIEEIIKWVPKAKAAFILPPNFDLWMERLENRGAMTHTEKSMRLKSAQKELAAALDERYFTLVVNSDIPTVAKQIVSGTTDQSSQLKNRRLVESLMEQIRHY